MKQKTLALQLINELEIHFSNKTMLSSAKKINKIYNILNSDAIIWEEIISAFGTESKPIFEKYSKDLFSNMFINEFFMKYHKNEKILKYTLVKELIHRDETVVFEMNALHSRVDVCRINGKSYAYEIKSEYDSLKRLDKQLSDYSKLFEYVYLIVTEKHLTEAMLSIPEHCGIILFSTNKLIKKKEASKSPFLSAHDQLSHLPTEQLINNFNIANEDKQKASLIINILDKYNAKTINMRFKRILKEKYKIDWQFVKDNYNRILPIDIESFFQTTMSPELIYYKNS